MHPHLNMTGRSALALYVANGVTGVRDMGGDLSVVRPWRDSVAAGSFLGPRIRTAGPIVESGKWLQRVIQMSARLESPDLDWELRRRLGVASAEDARHAVDTLVSLGVDFVKIRNFPAPEAYFALAREARTRGLRLAGHILPSASRWETSPTPALPAWSTPSSVFATTRW